MRRATLVTTLLGSCLAGCGQGTLDAVTLDPGSLAAGVVAHWSFDDGAGAVAADVSRNGHDGQLSGGTWTAEGRFGGALELAQGDFVTVMNFPQATAAWTVSVWVRMSAEQLQIGKAAKDWVTIISTENVFSGGWQMHVDHRVGFDRFDVAYWAGPTVNDYIVPYCQCIEVDTWIHLTAVFDPGAGKVFLYHDDTVVDSRVMPMPILPGDTTLYMGTWNMKDRYLAARIDDFTIWSRALGPEEIRLLATQPAPPPR